MMPERGDDSSIASGVRRKTASGSAATATTRTANTQDRDQKEFPVDVTDASHRDGASSRAARSSPAVQTRVNRRGSISRTRLDGFRAFAALTRAARVPFRSFPRVRASAFLPPGEGARRAHPPQARRDRSDARRSAPVTFQTHVSGHRAGPQQKRRAAPAEAVSDRSDDTGIDALDSAAGDPAGATGAGDRRQRDKRAAAKSSKTELASAKSSKTAADKASDSDDVAPVPKATKPSGKSGTASKAATTPRLAEGPRE